MTDDFITSKDEVSFKQIVMTHLQRILKLSVKEFRGGYWQTRLKGDILEKEYIPSATREFIQSVESFCYLLLPHFSEDMKEAYEKYEGAIEKEEKEIREDNKIKDKHFEFHERKLKHAQKLFKEINLLLEKKDYFGSEEYTEGID